MDPLKLENLYDPSIITINYSSDLNNSDEKSVNLTIPELKTWKVVEFSDSSLKIQLNFSHPELVSTNKKLDRVKIRLEKP